MLQIQQSNSGALSVQICIRYKDNMMTMFQQMSGRWYNIYDVNRSARLYKVNVQHVFTNLSPNIGIQCKEVSGLVNEYYFSVGIYQVDILAIDIFILSMDDPDTQLFVERCLLDGLLILTQ